MTDHYDLIIVGSGAGGGTLAHTLAPSGKRILILERGDFLPREKQNWDPTEVFVRNRYVSQDTWYDSAGKPFQPGVHYFVGGATKMFGAAMFRLRQHDFTAHRTADGMTPATKPSSRTTRRRSASITFMGSAATTLPTRRRARPTRTRT